MPFTWSLPPRHVRAWYIVSIAAEMIGLVSVSTYVPITLQMLAKNVGTWAPEHTIPCTQPAPDPDSPVCKAMLLGRLVDTGSFAMYVKSASILGQLFTVVSFGPFADDRRYRLRLLALFLFQSCFTAILFLFFPSQTYPALPLIAAVIVVTHYVGTTVSQMLLNSFLRSLAALQVAASASPDSSLENGNARRHRSPVIAPSSPAETRLDSTGQGGLERLPLLDDAPDSSSSPPPGPAPEASPASKPSDEQSIIIARLSSLGAAFGTISGVIGVALASVIVSWRGNTTRSLQDVLGFTGLITLALAAFGLFGLPRNDELDSKALHKRREPPSRPSWTSGWTRLGSVLRPREIRRLPNLFRFLLTWALLADAFHTTPMAMLLFLLSRLGATPAQTARFGLLPLFGGAATQLLVPLVQRYTGWHNRTFLVLAVLFPGIPCVRASMGAWAPASWGGGVHSVQDIYWFITPMGFGYGMFFAYARAFYAEMIPLGHESTFFSLFALFDRTSSFTGPLLVGIIANSSLGWNYVWLLLACMYTLPLVLLFFVDHAKGIEQGKAWRSGMD